MLLFTKAFSTPEIQTQWLAFSNQLDAPLRRRKEALLFRDSWGERIKFTSKSR